MKVQDTCPETAVRPHIQLADRLVRAVGFQSAVRACYENCWYGVLEHLAKNKPHYIAEHSLCGARH